jgi:hypothetical protein
LRIIAGEDGDIVACTVSYGGGGNGRQVVGGVAEDGLFTLGIEHLPAVQVAGIHPDGDAAAFELTAETPNELIVRGGMGDVNVAVGHGRLPNQGITTACL